MLQIFIRWLLPSFIFPFVWLVMVNFLLSGYFSVPFNVACLFSNTACGRYTLWRSYVSRYTLLCMLGLGYDVIVRIMWQMTIGIMLQCPSVVSEYSIHLRHVLILFIN
jgi:hypothetical protein